jgi:hypothetical protein
MKAKYRFNLRVAIRRFQRRLSDGQRWVVFDDGRVAFLVPSKFAMHRERDETVAVYPPGKDSGITIRYSLHKEALALGVPADSAVQFVTEQAAKQGLPLTRLSNRVFLSESREADWPDRRVLMHYWQVGAGQILVVCSATVWGADRESETVRRALASVSQTIESFMLT